MSKRTVSAPLLEVGIRSGQVFLQVWTEDKGELISEIIFPIDGGSATARWIGEQLILFSEVAERQ